MKNILYVFPEAELWVKPYKDHGYNILTQNTVKPWDNIHGLLMVPPYDSFSNAGHKGWNHRDEVGITTTAVNEAQKAFNLVQLYSPIFWAVAGPVGRMQRLLSIPDPVLRFNPNDYGDDYRRRINIWGVFNIPPKTPRRLPTLNQDAKDILRIAGQSKKIPKTLIPPKFAEEFMKANP
jgi:hypothetical protein